VTAIVILANLAMLVYAVRLGVQRVSAWPEPTSRPYACSTCRLDYADPRALAWHQQGQHGVEFRVDEIHVIPT
jgi:hypothetical protein